MRKFLVAFVACIVVILALVPRAAADIYRYTYTGNLFTTYGDRANCNLNALCEVSGVFGSYICPPACNVSGWFTVSAPIVSPDYWIKTTVVPIAFMFTDGLNIFTPESSPISGGFAMSTDAGGNIGLWDLSFQNLTDESLFTEFQGSYFEATDFAGSASNYGYLEGDRGTWSVSVSVPEPSAIEMLLMALLMFALVVAGAKTG